MSPKELEFRSELKKLCQRFGATIEYDTPYYPGEREDLRFSLRDEHCWIDIKDLAEYINE